MNCNQVPRPRCDCPTVLPSGSAYRRPARSDQRWSPAAVGLAVFLLNQKHRGVEEAVEGPFERAGNTVIAGLGVLGLVFAVCVLGACRAEEIAEVAKLEPAGQIAFWLFAAVVAVVVAATIIVIAREVL